MTEDHNIERLILASRNKFRALVDGLQDEVMTIGPDFQIQMVNKALADARNLHPREMVGQNCYHVVYGFDRPCPEMAHPCPALEAAAQKKTTVEVHEFPNQGPDGSSRFIEIRAMPLINGSETAEEVVLVRRDITLERLARMKLKLHAEQLEKEVAARTKDLVLANEELTTQRNELATANEEMRKLQNLKEELTNMVVHDLKGPLAEIQGNLEMMKTQELSELQNEFVEAAQLGSDDLLRMVTNLLDVSRLEEDRMVLDRTEFKPAEIIARICERYSPLARLSEVAVVREIHPDLPLLTADPRLFERIFNNLLSNALDHTPYSGRITIRAFFEDAGHRFEVVDTGIGIPEEMHEKIFEKFAQGEKDRPKTSTGLGLAFCRMAMEAHGGSIQVESRPGEGSKFILVFPPINDSSW